MAERSFAREVEDLQARRRRGLSRRRHSRDHQGAAAIRRLLCRRLSGRADLASDGRARRRQGRAERPRRAFRDLRLGGDRRRDALGLGHVSDPRRGDLEIDRRHQCRGRRAVQPLFGRRHRRRADHHRRGLWRGLLDHAGAQPRLCDEVADLAARSAPEPADAGAHGRGGLRAVGGVEHAGHARSAHPHLPRARAIRRQGQPASRPSRCARRWKIRCATSTASCCRPPRSCRRRRSSSSAGRRRSSSSRARKLNEIFGPARRRGRRHHAGRPVQHDDARAAISRPRRRLWRDPRCRSMCSTSPIR